MSDIGRPAITEEQYHQWFDELAPFFKLGETLNEAIEDAGLFNHRNSLYEKSRQNDWFSYKMQTYQAYPGKFANKILAKRVMQIDEKLKQGLPIDEEEMKDVRFVAEKHRSSAPHFVNRTETAPARPIEELLAELDGETDNINDVAESIKEQVVEIEPPLQDQEQSGPSGDVSPQPDAVPLPA